MKSITVKKLIKELQTRDPNMEIFIVNEEKARFDGLTKVFETHSVNGDKFLCLLAKGDILAI